MEDMVSRLLVVAVVVVVLVATVMLWPVKAEEVNEPVEEGPDRTIAWVKFDAYFTGTGPEDRAEVGQNAFDFKEIRVSKGEYVSEGSDVPTASLFKSLSLKWGNYNWKITLHLTGPGDTDLNDTLEFNHDLPEGKTTTLWDGSGVFYLNRPGTYTVTAQLEVVSYGRQEMDEPVLAQGSTTFEIPAAWAE